MAGVEAPTIIPKTLLGDTTLQGVEHTIPTSLNAPRLVVPYNFAQLPHVSIPQRIDLRHTYISKTEYVSLRRKMSEDIVGTQPLSAEEIYIPKDAPQNQRLMRENGVYQANINILIVDDQLPWLSAIAEEFRSQGHTIEFASSAEEAIQKLQRGGIDATTIDGLDGDWKQVYEEAGRQGIDAVVISGDFRIASKVGRFVDKSDFSSKALKGLFTTSGQTTGWGQAGGYAYDATEASKHNFYGFSEQEYLDHVATGDDPADWPSNQ